MPFPGFVHRVAVCRIYDPHEQWYIAHTLNLSWGRVARDYDYLLITQPLPIGHLPLPTKLVARNDAAEVLAINKQTR